MVNYLAFWNGVELTLLLEVEFWNASLTGPRTISAFFTTLITRLYRKFVTIWSKVNITVATSFNQFYEEGRPASVLVQTLRMNYHLLDQQHFFAPFVRFFCCNQTMCSAEGRICFTCVHTLQILNRTSECISAMCVLKNLHRKCKSKISQAWIMFNNMCLFRLLYYVQIKINKQKIK